VGEGEVRPLGGGKATEGAGRLGEDAHLAEAGDVEVGRYLPIPPHTSPYLSISPHTSPYLSISPHISHLAEGGTVDVGWYFLAVTVEALLAGEVLLVARLGEI